MWDYVACVPSVQEAEYTRNFERMLDARPGGITRVNKPDDIQFLPNPEKVSADCQGCGAPLKAYIHHCEYCRREK